MACTRKQPEDTATQGICSGEGEFAVDLMVIGNKGKWHLRGSKAKGHSEDIKARRKYCKPCGPPFLSHCWKIHSRQMHNNEAQHWPVFPKYYFAAGCCPMQHGIVDLLIAVGMAAMMAIRLGHAVLSLHFLGARRL